MITIILQGGLGNQMFQYAAAKALASRLNTNVRLDLSVFKIHHNKNWCRPYELDSIFDVDASHFYSLSLVKKIWIAVLYEYRYKPLGKWLKKFFHVFDSSTQSIDQWHQCQDNTTLWGYFGSEAYFKDKRNEILEVFRFKNILDEKNKAVAELIQNTNSVSVHIRRGDYLNEVNSKVFVSLTPKWYHEAIRKVKEKAENAHFFFFSDDMDWVRDTFGDINNATFVDWNSGADSYKDMQLMSLCKHNIIPNSTFSWWGAWLNTNPNKMVIAPAVFYVNEKSNDSYRQNMPKEWILL